MGKCEPDSFVADAESALKVEEALSLNDRPTLKGGKMLVLGSDNGQHSDQEQALMDKHGWIPYQELVDTHKDKGILP